MTQHDFNRQARAAKAKMVGRSCAQNTRLHALRHFYASWCINRTEDGGLGLPPKVVQERLGHSTITMTLDVYGRLFRRGEDHADQMDAGERRLLA